MLMMLSWRMGLFGSAGIIVKDSFLYQSSMNPGSSSVSLTHNTWEDLDEALGLEMFSLILKSFGILIQFMIITG